MVKVVGSTHTHRDVHNAVLVHQGGREGGREGERGSEGGKKIVRE